MLNLEPRLDRRLWAAIDNAYQGGNYTGAILDAIHFLGELIREKTGLDGDGVALVGQAFGGQNPKLKVTKLQTESDVNIQKGVESFLRGIYQGIRNPRSHEKYVDSVDDAEVLILFINYLAAVLDKAKGPFDKEAFLIQVFDQHFPENNRYANLLVERLPQGKRWDMLLEAYGRKEQGKGKKLAYFFRALLNALPAEEIDEFCGLVSQELETSTNDASIRAILQVIPSGFWSKYSELARIRTEDKLIESIRDGRYDPQGGKLTSGGLGTWAIGLPPFILKGNLLNVLSLKLGSSDANEQDYVFAYFFDLITGEPPDQVPWLVSRLKTGLKAGDARFRDAISRLRDWDEAHPWAVAVKDELDAFVEAQDSKITDADVPF